MRMRETVREIICREIPETNVRNVTKTKKNQREKEEGSAFFLRRNSKGSEQGFLKTSSSSGFTP
jgi:hypothetical protein